MTTRTKLIAAALLVIGYVIYTTTVEHEWRRLGLLLLLLPIVIQLIRTRKPQ